MPKLLPAKGHRKWRLLQVRQPQPQRLIRPQAGLPLTVLVRTVLRHPCGTQGSPLASQLGRLPLPSPQTLLRRGDAPGELLDLHSAALLSRADHPLPLGRHGVELTSVDTKARLVLPLEIRQHLTSLQGHEQRVRDRSIQLAHGRAEGCHVLREPGLQCHGAHDSRAAMAAATPFSARRLAARRPYNRAQKLVITSIISCTRSSCISVWSMTTTRLPDAAKAASIYSAPNRASRSR